MKTADHGQHASESKGDSIIGENTIWWSLAGLLIGSALGCFIGIAFGKGILNIPGLAPMVAGGAEIPAFIFSVFFASLLGLTGALLGTSSESGQAGKNSHNGHQSGKDRKGFVQQMPIYGSIGLVLFMALTFYVIASRAYGRSSPSDQSNRVTWNQKNAARIGARADAETATYVLQTAYPATRAENRPGAIVNVANDWRLALAATRLIARPTDAALILNGENGIEENTSREVERLQGSNAPTPSSSLAASPSPSASPVASPQAIGSPSPIMIYVGTVIHSTGREQIAGADAATIAAQLDERRAETTGSAFMNAVVVAADADYRWALPAGAYAARTGTSILFVTHDDIPPPTATALERRKGQAHMFVLGPDSAVSQKIFDRLKRYGSVTRVEGRDYFTNAVRFAEFRDDFADFGWGRSAHGSRKWSGTNVILVNGDRWQDGVLAAHLAHRGKSGPLLFSERDRLPAIVDIFLWRQRPVFANTPAEGPFNQIWVVGSFDRIAYGTQAWADYSQEIEQYMTLGDSAVSGYEALGVSWMFLSIACAIWILFHSTKRLPDAMPIMKAAWSIFALLLGPLALWLYIISYHRREKMQHEGMTMWQRPVWLQTVSATVMMFAFDMMLMCLAVFLLAYIGFPIISFNGPLYFVGTSMFLMMALMYIIALVAMMLVFHTPMTMHERNIKSYGKAFLAGFPIMVATMSVESLGMMPTMWWQQMFFLPAMQMPTGDDLTMWTTLLYSVFIGFLVVLPFNYWLVKRGKKIGTM